MSMNLSAHNMNHFSHTEAGLLPFLAAHTWQSAHVIIIILSSAALNGRQDHSDLIHDPGPVCGFQSPVFLHGKEQFHFCSSHETFFSEKAGEIKNGFGLACE